MAAVPRPDGARPGPPADRFGLLLLVLIVTYIMSSFVTGPWVSAAQIVLFVAVAVLAVRSGRVQRRIARVAVTVALAGSAAALVLALTGTGTGAGMASVWTGLVLLFAVVLIVRRVLLHRVITMQSIFGAVSAYMIIGLMFAAFYAAINRFGGGGFFAGGGETDLKTFQYFSFTTLTTLGYGDFTAASSGGRSVAVMEAMLGQIFLATLVARLVASFQPGSRAAAGSRAARGRGTGKARRRPARAGRRQATGLGRWRSGRQQHQPGAAIRRDTSSRAHAQRARR